PTRPFTADGPGTPACVWRHHLDPAAHDPLTLDGVRRVGVVSAPPDDEALGAGGLIAAARAAGVPAVLVCAPDGEGSHPGSPTHDAPAHAVRRAAEWEAAARELGVDATARHRLRLDDGDLERDVERLTQ